MKQQPKSSRSSEHRLARIALQYVTGHTEMKTASPFGPSLMNADLHHAVPDALRVIHADLASAAGHVRRAESRARWVVARSAGMRIVAVTAGLAAVVVVAERVVGGGGFGWVSFVILIGFLAVLFAGAATLRDSNRPDWRHVAERLDLAARDHNAIATALDLAQGGEPTAFARRAIADGIASARACGSTMPVIDPPPSARWRDRLLMSTGLAAVAMAWLTPLPQGERPLDPVVPGIFGSSLATTEGRSPVTPPPSNREAPAVRPPAAAQGPGAVSAAGSAAGSSERPAAVSNASSSAGAASAGRETDRPAVRSSEPALANATPSARSTPAPSGSRASRAASFGSASSDAAPSQADPEEGSGGGSSALFAAPSVDRLNNAGGAGGAPNKSPAVATAKTPGGSPGAGLDGPPTKLGSQSTSKIAESNEAAGGSGKGNGGGQSAPKKSRGVAPLMLGTREPDLILGRQLPGPDERTKLQVRPQSGPESPAADAPAGEHGIESPVDIFRLPPGSRQAVQDYFQMLHQ